MRFDAKRWQVILWKHFNSYRGASISVASPVAAEKTCARHWGNHDEAFYLADLLAFSCLVKLCWQKRDEERVRLWCLKSLPVSSYILHCTGPTHTSLQFLRMGNWGDLLNVSQTELTSYLCRLKVGHPKSNHQEKCSEIYVVWKVLRRGYILCPRGSPASNWTATHMWAEFTLCIGILLIWLKQGKIGKCKI